MSTLPAIQPHTEAKHHILSYYLDEWFPILGRAHRSLRYIDGFSGPGEYEGGQDGSPIIALRSVERHSQFEAFVQAGNTIEFLFVDKTPEYCWHLERKIGRNSWPKAFRVETKHGEFENVLSCLLDDAAYGRLSMPPTLIFIDPFGPSGFPMELLERLAKYERMDLLINLNCNEFVRWILPDPSKYVTADRLYGGQRWKPAINLSGRERTTFLVREYEDALGDIGWRGTSFEMVNSQNQTAYHLVFGTGSPKGMEAMKRAMRSASQTGEFRYTDKINPAQPVLLGLDMANEYPKEIGEHLFQMYEGQEVAFDYLMANEIDWHRRWLESDLRKGLNYLEYGENPRIAGVRNDDGRRRQKRSYPKGCFITFGKPQQLQLSMRD